MKLQMALKQLLEERDVYVAECKSCGFLVYARFLEDARKVAYRHDRNHLASVHKAGDSRSW